MLLSGIEDFGGDKDFCKSLHRMFSTNLSVIIQGRELKMAASLIWPLPVSNLWHVLSVPCYVILVFYQFIPDELFEVCGLVS